LNPRSAEGSLTELAVLPDFKVLELSHPVGTGNGPPPFFLLSSNICLTRPPTLSDSSSEEISEIDEAMELVDVAEPPGDK
jgi:hypothetical protein